MAARERARSGRVVVRAAGARDRGHRGALAVVLGFASGAFVTATAAEAMAQVLRFADTAPGGIVATGNALGLSKVLDANGPGTEDSIGTFITTGNTTDEFPTPPVGNPWPLGTTNDWTQNSSSAVLSLSGEATVLYAELIWGGSYYYGTEDVSGSIDEAVTLSMGSFETTVAPDSATSLTIAETAFTGFAVNYYLRSAEVTSFVAQHRSGPYVVAGVPATQDTLVDELNAAGWTLVVVYRDETMPIRNLSVFVGGSFVDEDAHRDYDVSGFCAPPFGPVEGHVVVSALEGDADRAGDLLSLAPTASGPFVDLSGPNNPADNFFCSQINDATGVVDTQGSFGNANHDATSGVNVSGGRQGWDVTTVEVSSTAGHLVNDQSSAVIRTSTNSDSYVPALIAFEIDVKSPDFTQGGSTTLASRSSVSLGDSFTVAARLDNQGEATAANLVLHLPIDSGLALTAFTLDGAPGDVNGSPVTADDLSMANGVEVGELDVGSLLEVVLSLDVVGPPSIGSQFTFVPTWEHSFQMCSGGPILSDSYTSQTAVVAFEGGGGAGASGAGGPGGGGVGGGGLAPLGADPGSEGGCGCATPGTPGRLGGLVGLALVVLGRARRSRRRPG